MSEQFELSVEARNEHGTAISRRLRHQEKIPAVLYGAGEAPQSLTIEHRLIIKALEHEGFTSSVITLNVDGKKVKAVLKAVQRHAYKPKVMHADFQRISDKDKITMRVPLHFVGGDVCPGVKLRSGIVSQHINDVEIQCLPSALPEHITVDLTNLDVEKSVHLSDLALPEGVALTINIVDNPDQNQAVAAITIPRSAVAAGEESSAGDDSDEDNKSE